MKLARQFKFQIALDRHLLWTHESLNEPAILSESNPLAFFPGSDRGAPLLARAEDLLIVASFVFDTPELDKLGEMNTETHPLVPVRYA